MEFQQKRTDKTLWLNVISIVVLSIPFILTALEKIQPEWGVLAGAIGSLIVGIGNIIIRFYTDKPLDTPGNREKQAARMTAPEQMR